MDQSEDKARLIGNRRTAVVALCLTGFVAALSFRELLSHAQHKSYWLLDLRGILPAPTAAVVNVGFYAYVLWLAVVFYRGAQGKERVLVAGWFGTVFLGWIRNLVSMPVAATLDWAKAFCMLLAFLAAVDILLRTLAGNGSRAYRNI
ncbi:MAG: hypothetical protein ACLP3K_00180 [Candidatus Acidiferrales bacterium]